MVRIPQQELQAKTTSTEAWLRLPRLSVETKAQQGEGERGTDGGREGRGGRERERGQRGGEREGEAEKGKRDSLEATKVVWVLEVE